MPSPVPNILIIDDTEANRYAFGRLLRSAGYKTEEADTIAAGLEILREKKIDLLILDVQLPDGNGFDICARLKADPVTASLPILMTSAAFVEGRDKAQGFDRGADGYLTTPIDSLELIATVKALLRIRDTEHKLQEALKKAEAANEAKSDFLANMSHEIRTPMNAILGLSHILATTPLSIKQQQCVSTIQESANALMTLINDLLDITKIEDNKVELESTTFSLNELIERIVGIAKVPAKNDVSIFFERERGIADWYIGDPQRLYQALLNLVSNAVKFTKEGSVTIAVKVTGTEEDSDKVQISVTDTGIGIPADKLDLIFNKFTQADTSTTRKYGGSGLGLTIAKRLIEQMNGSVRVSSIVGKGSVFTIEVPLKATAPEKGQKTAKIKSDDLSPISPGHGKILLVEDHKPNILVASTLLEKFGYECMAATSGADALALFREHRFEAVIMDIQMQDMDGYEATRLIRTWEVENKAVRTPIIAMTANALVGDREKCILAGMDDYMSKPVNPLEFEKMLTRYAVTVAA